MTKEKPWIETQEYEVEQKSFYFTHNYLKEIAQWLREGWDFRVASWGSDRIFIRFRIKP